MDNKIYVGPVWDFDIAFENDQRTYPINSKKDFVYRSGGSCTCYMKTFVDNIVVRNAAARAQLVEIWDEARQGGLTEEHMVALIDSLEQELDQSQRLNFIRWPIMNILVHQNPRTWGSYKAEVQNVRRFMKERIAWMDKKLGYTYVPNGIADVQPSGSDVLRYYDLQGRPVEQPASGIYILRTSDDVRRGLPGRKVVVK